jgi:hypothetical protein
VDPLIGLSSGDVHTQSVALDIKENVDSLPANAMVVLQLFDNVASHAIAMGDTIIPCKKDQQGNYRVDMDLLLLHQVNLVSSP